MTSLAVTPRARSQYRSAAFIVSAAAAMLISPPSWAQAVNDPFEASNRVVFAGNQFIGRYVFAPVAKGYTRLVPETARTGIHNFASNCDQPVVAANDLLQGRFDRASDTMRRFALNTSIGIGGLRDVASERGYPEHAADFGQTLGVWGVDAGPSVQLPLMGPSNLRDTMGQAASSLANPGTWMTGGAAIAFKSVGAVKLVDRGMSGPHAKEPSGSDGSDPYLASRDAATRRRAALVAGPTTGVRHEPLQ